MCYNCGCHNPHDDMGHPDNIIDEKQLKDLATHWDKSLADTKNELYKILSSDEPIEDDFLNQIFDKAAKAWGQSVDEAKKNTYKELKNQLS